MRKIILVTFLTCCSFILFSQEKEQNIKPSIEIGYSVLFNNLNSDNYANFKSSLASWENTALNGMNIKFAVNSKHSFIDYFVGTTFMVGADQLGSTSWTSGNTNSSDYIINGGGVYAGISPKLKKKHFGLTSEFAIGVFSFKEYLAIFNNTETPVIDIYDKKTSSGLGAISSVGFYFKIGKIGISPEVTAIFSGSSSASFIFYGFNIPLSYQF
ncbi:MAG: hypothetical protein PHW92_15130 [Lutibacter sp.]|nr:hypothetical protein [Lutibacter sp.]